MNNMTAPALATALGMKRTGRLWVGTCPACGYPGTFTAEERDGTTLVYCHACRDQGAVLATLRTRGLWEGATTAFHEEAPPCHALHTGPWRGGLAAVAPFSPCWRDAR